MDKQSLQASHDRITYHDNDTTGSVLSLGYKVLDPQGAVNGLYLGVGSLGIGRHFEREWFTLPVVGDVPLLVVITWQENVILLHEVAQEFVDNPPFDPETGLPTDGFIANAAEIMLEEIMHSVFDALDVDDVEEEHEENAIQDVIGVLNEMIAIKVILKADVLSVQNLHDLRQKLSNIRVKINALCRDVGDEVARVLLESLGLQDDDGNGIPDIIDDILDDNGINEDDLPGPPGGGDPDGPQEVPDDPPDAPSDVGPFQQPEDPHQQLPE